jgi:hypothetical protein
MISGLSVVEEGFSRKFAPHRAIWAAVRRQPFPKTFLLLFCASFFACAHRSPAGPAVRAPVVVSVVIDQLAAWIADERFPLLPAAGGFARLRREGVYVRDLRYGYAITETGPGHAALYTACAPWRSGIFANYMLQPDGQDVPLLIEAQTQELLPTGALVRPSFSLERLTCETVADRLRAAAPQAWIVSLSFKDRGALIPGGKHADASLWFDTTLDTFATSSAVASVFPPWAVSVAGHDSIARSRPAQWDLLDPGFVRSHALGPDEAPGESNFCDMGTVFPHPITGPNIGAAFRSTPFADAFLLQLGTKALEADETPEAPALLELSLSSNDLIGHAYGPESWEAWDELLRLDRSLAEFMDRLDAAYGPEGWSMVLSADHGVTVLPESCAGSVPWCAPGARNAWNLPCAVGSRIPLGPMLLRLRIAAELALGKGDWVVGISPPYVLLTNQARALSGPRRDKLDRALRGVLEAQPGIAMVFETRALPSPCPDEGDDSIAALVCRSVVKGQGGDFYLVTQPGSFFDPHGTPAKGTDHGSPYLFDRSVPLLARIPGKLPRGEVLDGPLPYETFARALATALGVDFPAADRGADLTARPHSQKQ